jgi:hypothetical protein
MTIAESGLFRKTRSYTKLTTRQPRSFSPGLAGMRPDGQLLSRSILPRAV